MLTLTRAEDSTGGDVMSPGSPACVDHPSVPGRHTIAMTSDSARLPGEISDRFTWQLEDMVTP